MNIPHSKTKVRLHNDIHQSFLKKGDVGYIDGYVQAPDGRPYSVFVRRSDGLIDLVPVYQAVAIDKF